MPYKDWVAQRNYQRAWIAKKEAAKHKEHICADCGTTKRLTFGKRVLCVSCLHTQTALPKRIPVTRKKLALIKKNAKFVLRRKAGVRYVNLEDGVAFLWGLAFIAKKRLNNISTGGYSMDIEIIAAEISNPAHKELARGILQIVDDVKNGKKSYNQASTELDGCKQVIQIMALEMMRRRVHAGFISDGRS